MVEVIDTARDNLDLDKIEREAGIVDEEASSDSDSSSDEVKEELPDGSAQHKQGLMDQLRDYKRRDKALHRQHRGLMQWKVRHDTLYPQVLNSLVVAMLMSVGSEDGEMDEAQDRKGGRECVWVL